MTRKIFLAVALFASFWMNATAAGPASSDGIPVISDDEEYAVMAAILFPDLADDSAGLSGSAPGRPPRVLPDGIPTGLVTIRRLTVPGKIQDRSADQEAVGDYNRKNKEAAKISEEKLQPYVSTDGRLNLVADRKIDISPGGSHRLSEPVWRDGDISGVTSFSRPGFNRSRTKAIISVSHVADYEMGIGYRVYLEKSTATGKWNIEGAVTTRIY